MTEEHEQVWEENREFLSVGQLFTSCSISHTRFCPSRAGEEGKQGKMSKEREKLPRKGKNAH